MSDGIAEMNCYDKANSEILPGLSLVGHNTTGSYVFFLIADKTSDIFNKEQVSNYIQYCANSFHNKEVFLGFFQIYKTDFKYDSQQTRENIISKSFALY